MTERELIPMCEIERSGPVIGAWPVCASARSDLAGNWKCGVSLERAPKLICVSPPRLLTNHPLLETMSGYFGKRRRTIMKTTLNPIRILLADDHPVLRQGIQALASDERDMQFVAEASNGLEAIEQFRKHQPDIALMDLEMPGVNGIDAMIAIRNEFPDARIIILTTYAGDVRISRALKAGARGYLLKSLLRKELLDTIRAVHAGQKRIPADLATQVADHVADDPLTLREIEVLRAIAAGNANKLIPYKLSITEETVKGHVKNILSKLGANDRTHAVTIGLKRGIMELKSPQKGFIPTPF